MTQSEITNASVLTHTVNQNVLSQKTAGLLKFAAKMNLTIKPNWIQFLLKLKFWYEVACFVVQHVKEIVEYINKKKNV